MPVVYLVVLSDCERFRFNLFMKRNSIFFFQNFEPVPYPKKEHGKFYTGDSYIILNVCRLSMNFCFSIIN